MRKTSQTILNKAVQTVLQDLLRNPNHFQQMQLEDLRHYIKKIQDLFGTQLTFRNVVNLETVNTLISNASAGCCIAMRHGEQASNNIVGLSDEMAKIIQMRHENNVNDPITERSAIEFIATMIIFKYLQNKYNIQFQIQSSQNQRALQPAQALATLLEIPCAENTVLNCVDYPDDKSDAELKKILNNGALPWKKENVDAVCGANTFDNICKNMQRAFDIKNIAPKQVRLMFTHTQQINAVCEAQQKPVTRFDHYGLIGLSAEQVFLYDQGLYCKQPTATSTQQAKFPHEKTNSTSNETPRIQSKL